MLHLPENLKKYRMMKNLTREDVITFLPALANIFETSVDLLLGE